MRHILQNKIAGGVSLQATCCCGWEGTVHAMPAAPAIPDTDDAAALAQHEARAREYRDATQHSAHGAFHVEQHAAAFREFTRHLAAEAKASAKAAAAAPPADR